MPFLVAPHALCCAGVYALAVAATVKGMLGRRAVDLCELLLLYQWY